MHKILLDKKEYTYSNSSGFFSKMFYIKEIGRVEDSYIYVDPNLVKDDKEYFKMLSLRDSNVDFLKEKGNRFEVDYYFSTIELIDELEIFK